MLEGDPGGGTRLFLAMFTPGQIIKRPATVGDAPVGHDASGIEFERLEKALDALGLVEAKAPVQAQIEPALCLERRRGYGPCMSSKIEAVHSRRLRYSRRVAQHRPDFLRCVDRFTSEGSQRECRRNLFHVRQ